MDEEVLTWDGDYYKVQHLSWLEGDNEDIAVFISESGSDRDVKLWAKLPNQPERLNPEGFQRTGAQQNINLEYISMVLGPEFVKSSDSLNSMET